MADTETQANDELVQRAGRDADALGMLYNIYYERIFRFCVHRLFTKEAAQDVTSEIFLQVAQAVRSFSGRTERDFAAWLYAIAANHSNAYLRKTSRRKNLFDKVAPQIVARGISNDTESSVADWPTVFKAVSKLKPKHQTIVTLRFFENLSYDEIGRIVNADPVAVRVALHRILKKLRKHLQTILDGDR